MTLCLLDGNEREMFRILIDEVWIGSGEYVGWRESKGCDDTICLYWGFLWLGSLDVSLDYMNYFLNLMSFYHPSSLGYSCPWLSLFLLLRGVKYFDAFSH